MIDCLAAFHRYIPDLAWVHLAPMHCVGTFNDGPYIGRQRWVLVPETKSSELDVSAKSCSIVRHRSSKRTQDADKDEWALFKEEEEIPLAKPRKPKAT